MKRLYERIVKDTPLSFNLSSQVVQAIESHPPVKDEPKQEQKSA